MRSALLIANPIAGRGAGERELRRIEPSLRSRGIDLEVAVTSQAGDAQAAAASRAEDHEAVLVIGGDGTLNEVVNGLEADRPVAIYPIGTGNVLAKELGLPRSIVRFCNMVQGGREHVVDIATIGDRRFVSMAGAGFDADVAADMGAGRTAGIHMAAYIGRTLRHLARYDFPRISVAVDGGEPVDSAGFVLVSNVRSYGGPFVVTPDARHDDGLLDVCLLRRGTPLAYMAAMLAFILRCHRAARGARYLRGRSIRLSASTPVRYQVDGDAAGFLPATIEILDRTLRFIVP